MGNDIDTDDIIRRRSIELFRGNPQSKTPLPNWVELYDAAFGPLSVPRKPAEAKVDRKHLRVVK